MELLEKIKVGSSYGTWYLRLYEDSISQSIANNESIVTLRLTLGCDSSPSSISFDNRDAWINSTHFTLDYSHNQNEHNLGTISMSVKHNQDGTGSYSVPFGIKTSYILNGSGTGGRTLPTIPRASSIGTISGSTLGSAITVNINRAATSFTHTLTYQFGSIKRTYSNQGTSCTFTPPLSDASAIPNATKGTATISIQTYSGSTAIGSPVAKTITLNLPDSVVPSIQAPTITRVDNGVPAAWGVYVKGFSKAKVSISGSGIYGSTISSYTIRGANYSSDSSTLSTGVIETAGTVNFTGTIGDSRGRFNSASANITVYDYSVPSVKISAERCNASGTASSDGVYAKVTVTYSIASVNGKNSVSAKKIEVVGTSLTNTSFTSGTVVVIGGGISTDKSYPIKVTITDALGKSSVAQILLPTAEVLMDLKASGKGVAFGKVAESDLLLESAWNIKAPSMTTSDWYRSTGATGWYSTTYGGGIHMNDSTYVRVYNGKAFYVANTGDNALYTAGGVNAARGKFSGVVNAGTLQQGGTAINTLIANSVNAQPQLVSVAGWDEAWKFPSGLMIIRFWSYAKPSWGSWGSLYEYILPGSKKAVPAGTFIGNPSWFCGTSSYGTSIGWMVENGGGGSVTKCPEFAAVRTSNYVANVDYCIVGIGRWK